MVALWGTPNLLQATRAVNDEYGATFPVAVILGISAVGMFLVVPFLPRTNVGAVVLLLASIVTWFRYGIVQSLSQKFTVQGLPVGAVLPVKIVVLLPLLPLAIIGFHPFALVVTIGLSLFILGIFMPRYFAASEGLYHAFRKGAHRTLHSRRGRLCYLLLHAAASIGFLALFLVVVVRSGLLTAPLADPLRLAVVFTTGLPLFLAIISATVQTGVFLKQTGTLLPIPRPPNWMEPPRFEKLRWRHPSPEA